MITSLAVITEKAGKPLAVVSVFKRQKLLLYYFPLSLTEKVEVLRLWLLTLAFGFQLGWSQQSVSFSYFSGNSCVQYSHLSPSFHSERSRSKHFFFVVFWIIDPLNIKICIKLQTPQYCNRKLSKAGVSLLKAEPRIRGAADGVLHSVRTLPCHIIRWTPLIQDYPFFSFPFLGVMWGFIVLVLLQRNDVACCLLQFSCHLFVWEEDAVPWFCWVTAESHEADAPTRPG